MDGEISPDCLIGFWWKSLEMCQLMMLLIASGQFGVLIFESNAEVRHVAYLIQLGRTHGIELSCVSARDYKI